MFKFKKNQQVNVIYALHPGDEGYDDLGKFQGNRKTKSLNVRRIAESMKKRNFLNCIPIIITKDWRIIDGQHRDKAATILQITKYVIVVEDEDVEAIAIALNNNKSNWTLGDFAKY